MVFPRLLRLLYDAGWEFWLPLPVVAALFWSMGNLITSQVLSRPHDSVNKLQADTQLDIKLSVTILAINAEIDRSRGMTTVLIKTANSTLKTQKYEFPVTQASQVEAAIAQKLGMPSEAVRKLVSYQIKE